MRKFFFQRIDDLAARQKKEPEFLMLMASVPWPGGGQPLHLASRRCPVSNHVREIIDLFFMAWGKRTAGDCSVAAGQAALEARGSERNQDSGRQESRRRRALPVCRCTQHAGMAGSIGRRETRSQHRFRIACGIACGTAALMDSSLDSRA
jgi:hypothetical protein